MSPLGHMVPQARGLRLQQLRLQPQLQLQESAVVHPVIPLWLLTRIPPCHRSHL